MCQHDDMIVGKSAMRWRWLTCGKCGINLIPSPRGLFLGHVVENGIASAVFSIIGGPYYCGECGYKNAMAGDTCDIEGLTHPLFAVAIIERVIRDAPDSQP